MPDIFLDLDGTLTDPWDGITRSILYALDKFDAPHPSEQQLRRFIGPSLWDTFGELLGPEHADQAVAFYRERFADVGWQENRVYDGIPEALQSMRDSGARLFVATTKPWVFARKIVEHFGIGEHFTEVFGSELDGTRTDKTELLAYAREKLGANGAAAMIGDRRHDIIGGRNNNLNVIGVSYGYGTREELEAAGADRIAARPDEIPALVLDR